MVRSSAQRGRCVSVLSGCGCVQSKAQMWWISPQLGVGRAEIRDFPDFPHLSDGVPLSACEVDSAADEDVQLLACSSQMSSWNAVRERPTLRWERQAAKRCDVEGEVATVPRASMREE